jgi:Rieske Fe-S protein
MKMQRRAFLKTTSCSFACLCLAGSEALKAAETPYADSDSKSDNSELQIDLNKHPQLKEIGGSETFTVNKKKVIVIHPDEKGYKAFENKCTHKSGQVSYRPKDGFMQCALHGSRFNTEGQVIKGPAEKSLTELRTSLNQDRQLTVYLT